MLSLERVLASKFAYEAHVFRRMSVGLEQYGYVQLAREFFPILQAVYGRRLQFVTVDIAPKYSILVARLFQELGLAVRRRRIGTMDSYLIEREPFESTRVSRV